MLLGARQFFERRVAPPLPYRRQVEYIDTNGGGCTMSDLTIAPEYGFRMKGRIAVVTATGNIIFGGIRNSSDYDQRGYRTFFSYLAGHYVAWQDIPSLRVRTSTNSDVFALDTFFDFDILSQSTQASSYIKINDVNLLSSYEHRGKSSLGIPFSICKETNTSTIYGQVKISSLTLMQGNEIIADFLPVETFDGEAGLYNSVNGNIYTSTAGNQFALPS